MWCGSFEGSPLDLNTDQNIFQYNKYISRYNSIKSWWCLQVAVTAWYVILIWYQLSIIIGQNSKEHDKSFTDVTMVKATCAYPTLSQNLCLNHPNLQHANSCKHMSQEPLDCFLGPGRSICTWGSVWSSAKPGGRSFPHREKRQLHERFPGWTLPAATGTQTPGEHSDSESASDPKAVAFRELNVLHRFYQAKLNHVLSPQKSLFAEATYPSHVAMKVNTYLS